MNSDDIAERLAAIERRLDSIETALSKFEVVWQKYGHLLGGQTSGHGALAKLMGKYGIP